LIEKKEKAAKPLKLAKADEVKPQTELRDAVAEAPARPESSGYGSPLAGAGWSYGKQEVPGSRKEPSDPNWLWELALELAALGAALALVNNSELPVMVGLRRRKDKAAEVPPQPPKLYT